MGKLFQIAVLPGDGIGPDIVAQAIKVLDRAGELYDASFQYEYGLAGGCAIDACGEPLPAETVSLCKGADSVLLGAVGGPKWDIPGRPRPEQAPLGIRKEMEVFSNLRPVKLFSQLKDASPLKESILQDGIDIMIVRELTGGIYFGKSGMMDADTAYDTESYSAAEIRRVCENAFAFAAKRRKKLCLVDKANVLESSRLWRKVFKELAAAHPDIAVDFMYVDNAAMQLVRNPSQFDVIVTSNMFGDILSDEASMLTGSIGMLPSGSLGVSSKGIYEPIHGSAPDIAGTDKANPLATILSAAMMLRYSLDLPATADAIENAVEQVLNDGYRTADIMQTGCCQVGTEEMGRLVIERLR